MFLVLALICLIASAASLDYDRPGLMISLVFLCAAFWCLTMVGA